MSTELIIKKSIQACILSIFKAHLFYVFTVFYQNSDPQ